MTSLQLYLTGLKKMGWLILPMLLLIVLWGFYEAIENKWERRWKKVEEVKEYALYKGEEIIAIGTISEIAEELGVQEQTVAYYKTQAYQNRLRRRNAIDGNVRVLIPLDED